ncbi:MAG: cache domain-containing protein, partial [Nitrospirota bacterium]
MEVKNVKRGIRRRIVISMLIIGIVPLVAGLYLTYLDGTNALRNSIGANFQELAKETANKVDMVIKKEIIDVQRLAISSEVKDAVKNKKYGSSELINYLNKFKSFNEKEVYALIVVDTKGRYVGGFKEDVEKNYSNEKWFKDSINNSKVYVGDLKLDDTFGMHLMSIAAPVIDYERVIAVVVIKYSVDKLLEVVNSVRIEKTGH